VLILFQIVNWFPVGYTDISSAGKSEISKAPALIDVLNARGERYNRNRIYVACYGEVRSWKYVQEIEWCLIRGKSVARGPAPPPIEMLFQIFRLNFSWDMSKMHYFSNEFSKIAKCWGLSFPIVP